MYADFGRRHLPLAVMLISFVVLVLTVLEMAFLQELIKDQVANMYLWPKTLEVPIMDPAKYVLAFFFNLWQILSVAIKFCLTKVL